MTKPHFFFEVFENFEQGVIGLHSLGESSKAVIRLLRGIHLCKEPVDGERHPIIVGSGLCTYPLEGVVR